MPRPLAGPDPADGSVSHGCRRRRPMLSSRPTRVASGGASMEQAADLAAGATRYAGSRVRRVEDARLLTGRGTFVDDVTRPGMLHACFVRSPLARARVESIDATDALALPGVRAVFVAADL